MAGFVYQPYAGAAEKCAWVLFQSGHATVKVLRVPEIVMDRPHEILTTRYLVYAHGIPKCSSVLFRTIVAHPRVTFRKLAGNCFGLILGSIV